MNISQVAGVLGAGLVIAGYAAMIRDASFHLVSTMTKMAESKQP